MESISLACVVELGIHVSVSALMSGLWLSVTSLSAVTCSGVSMELVLRVQMRRTGQVRRRITFWQRL